MDLSGSDRSFESTKLPAKAYKSSTIDTATPDKVNLEMLVDYLEEKNKHLIHVELLRAEKSDYACSRDLFACRDCLRLRHATEFADNILKGKRRVNECKANKRFCINCGLNSKDNTPRYTPSSNIIRNGRIFVICIECGGFGEGVKGDDKCCACWDKAESESVRRGLEKLEAMQWRHSQRAARNARRAVARQQWNKDKEEISSDEDIISQGDS